MTGWWSGTFYLFIPYVGKVIIPTDKVIFFRGVAQPPTSMMFSPLKCVKSVRCVQVHAATDVTGFGLQPSGTGCRIPGEKMWLELGNYHGITVVGYCWLGYGATTMARYIQLQLEL